MLQYAPIDMGVSIGGVRLDVGDCVVYLDLRYSDIYQISKHFRIFKLHPIGSSPVSGTIGKWA
jgi:hypothetical protein